MAERNRRVVGWWLVGAAMVLLSCTHQAGQPRPVETPASPSASSTTPTRLDDLDLCQVLTPADFPFQPSDRFPPQREVDPDGGCGWLANKGDNPFDDFLTGVDILSVPFRRYNPPPSAPNGRSAVIAGRPAWVGTVFPAGVGTDCEAAFGTADRTIVVSLIDDTEDHPDPCVTVVGLAEVVASRTPPPNE